MPAKAWMIFEFLIPLREGLAVGIASGPELTRSADIKLNTRLRLLPAVAIVSSPAVARCPHGHTEPALNFSVAPSSSAKMVVGEA
jgi:hypothetical protein